MSKLQSCGLRLEPFDDGAAAPTLSVVPTADTHLLSSSDLSSFNVLLARAKAVASPAAEYFHKSVEGKRGAQLARMRAARLFNPLHVLSSGAVTEADIDALELFRFSKHAKIAPKIQVGGRKGGTQGDACGSAHLVTPACAWRVPNECTAATIAPQQVLRQRSPHSLLRARRPMARAPNSSETCLRTRAEAGAWQQSIALAPKGDLPPTLGRPSERSSNALGAADHHHCSPHAQRSNGAHRQMVARGGARN